MTTPMHLNLFIMGCGHHKAAWREPGSAAERMGDIGYYESLARTAERGKLDAVFFADGHAAGNVSGGPQWFLEPLTALSAMARATEHIGLISTISSTFFSPFHAARMLASLDHISNGRMGWNLVTSMFDSEARNHGFEAMPPQQVRYARAEEFAQTVLALWDSWADDALRCDRAGQYADPRKVRPIDHHGEHFLVNGPLTVPRPPQGILCCFKRVLLNRAQLGSALCRSDLCGGLRPPLGASLLPRHSSPRAGGWPRASGDYAWAGHICSVHRGRRKGKAA